MLATVRNLNPFVRLLLFLLFFAACVAPLLIIPDQLIQLTLGTAILVGLLVLHARCVERADERIYGLSWDGQAWIDCVIGLVIGVLSVAAMLALAASLGLVISVQVEGMIFSVSLVLLLVQISLVSVWEEALFRGFLLAQLSMGFGTIVGRRIAVFASVCISSLLFAIVHAFTDHFSLAALAVLTLNGVAWCIPVLLTGRLGLSIGLHAAWNLGQLKIFGFAMSGNQANNALLQTKIVQDSIWSGKSYGPEAGLLGVFGISIMLACSLIYCLFTQGRQIRELEVQQPKAD